MTQSPPDSAEAAAADVAGTLPLLPTRELIVFPRMVAPLFVGHDKSVKAIDRAFDQHGDSRRLAEMAELMRSLSRQVEQVNRDLLAERLGRVEDLELIVDLVSTGFSALRDDVATMGAMVDRVGTNVGDVIEKLDQPLQVTVERPTRRGVVDLFSPTVATEPDDPGPDATA